MARRACMVERLSSTRIAEPRVTKRSARHPLYCASLTCSSHATALPPSAS